MNIVDMHCDTIWYLLEKEKEGKTETLRSNAGHLDLEKLRKSNYLAQNFALFVKLGKQEDAWERVQELLRLYQREISKNDDWAAPAYTYTDILQNKKNGKISAILTVEEGGVCKGQTEKLFKLYEQGVRMMTLVWNYPNELGYPSLNKGQLLNTPNTAEGLTETGRVFVAEMENMGMIIDVSHMSDAGFYDVLHETHKPFVASHSNARAICPCARNLSDDMIRALAERGGVMGLNFCADFLTQLPPGVHNPGTLESIIRHARHIADIGGMECIGLGSDFDGIDTHEELPGADKMDRLYDALYKGGFTESQIDKIFSENVLRVYKELLA